MTDVVTAII